MSLPDAIQNQLDVQLAGLALRLKRDPELVRAELQCLATARFQIDMNGNVVERPKASKQPTLSIPGAAGQVINYLVAVGWSVDTRRQAVFGELLENRFGRRSRFYLSQPTSRIVAVLATGIGDVRVAAPFAAEVFETSVLHSQSVGYWTPGLLVELHSGTVAGQLFVAT